MKNKIRQYIRYTTGWYYGEIDIPDILYTIVISFMKLLFLPRVLLKYWLNKN